jgi:class I lanthipeptide synthase
MSEWRPLLDGSSAEDAKGAARKVGERLRDPGALVRAIEAAPAQSASPEYAAWRPMELAQGHAGLALSFAQFDACFPAKGWSSAAHAQLELTVAALRREPAAATGLISGLAGVALAAHIVDRNAYARLLSTLDGLIARRTEAIVKRIDARESGVAEHDIDVVSGLAGVGAYFLTRGEEGSVRAILERLVRLICADGPVPAWHAPPELLTDEDATGAYPAGRLNLGLAHGLPGPLALLALSSRAGLETARLSEAIERASSLLVDHAISDEWGINWPGLVPVGSDGRPARAAWCYGAPGVARALWLAGVALDDSRLRQLAVAALEAVHRRPTEIRNVDAPTFCHGIAGLLQITLRMADDSGSRELQLAGRGLAGQLIDRFEPDSVLGYRDLEPDGRSVDQAGVLQGAAGTALVLLAAAAPVTPRWDRAFLLS